ncbi:MAG: DUF4988 domain-containing protein [Muribaculaceae bacterium]|nr:DUF4988 domain-containing protein [Muribaculaceae bacterium]
MNKKLINGILIASLMAGGAASFTSCSDYGDDIDNLQSQIDGITAQVSDLQSKIQSGKIISSVVKTDNGLAITIDGTTYNITNGDKGADAAVWSIGEDGFWYKDGVKTDYKAIGTDGKDGQDGKDGADGKDGQNGTDGAAGSGIYYVPNVETGMFDIYKDGEKIGDSEIAWNTASGSGMTAVFDGVKLILSGVEGADADLELYPGRPVGSIAFVPSKMSNGIATPDNAFYYVGSYFKSATDFTVVTKDVYMPNEVAMTYRVNPSSAAISETAFYSFINRDVELSRAGQEDQTNLLSVTSAKINDEKQIEVSASANRAAFLDKNGKPKYSVTNGEGKLPIAALVLWNGQARTVSDYITVAAPQQLNKLTIANIAGVEKDDMVPYEGLAQRTANFPTADGETAGYLAGLPFSGKGAAASIVYTNTTAATGLDLTTVVGLFAEDNILTDANIGFMEDLGFSGITYKFSKPSKYIGTGDTNQQDFVDLNGSILTVTTDSKLTGTAAIGRTPIIRVDAYMNDNFVASAYMKIKITEDAFTGGDTEVTIPTKSLIYNDLSEKFTTVGSLSWQDVNKYFYGDNGLTAESFWKNYDKNVKVVATALGTDGKPVNVATDGTTGLKVNRNFITENPTGTDALSVQVNNAIQTQYEKDKNNAGYQDVNGQGAQYTVTITIPALDPLVRGNIVMTQTFYVKEAHTKYTLNSVYNVEGTNMISTNGIIGKNGVNMSLNLFTAFASADVLDKDGKVVGATEIMNFYNTAAPVNGAFEAQTVAGSTNPIANAKSIKFEVIPAKDKKPVAKIQADGYTIVPTPQMMTVPSVKTTVRYTITLENGAICPFDFEVEFVNPLMAAKTISKLKINGNATTDEDEAAESVKVVTSGKVNSDIYKWFAKSGTTPAGLRLTDLGKNSYKLDDNTIEVEYDIEKNAAYNAFVGQLVSGKLEIDTKTGKITYTKGASIQKGATLNVIATVTFPDLSKVEVNIPLEVTTE